MSQHTFERASLPSAAPEILVLIEQCQDGIPSGRIVNDFVENPTTFHGFADLLLKMDAIYDYLDFPQASRETRTFSRLAAEEYERLAPYTKRSYTVYMHQAQTKSMLTLLVKTRFRQNGSWQGILLWLEAEKEQRFVSALQCLKLMNEALLLTTNQKQSAPKTQGALFSPEAWAANVRRPARGRYHEEELTDETR